jgi:Bacterial toxin 3
LPDDYRIVATPSLRVVSPGAKVTYRLERKNPKAKPVDQLTCWWWCLNDPASISWYEPKRVGGPLGPAVWRDAEWEFPGRHRIVCHVDDGDTKIDVGYDQEVATLPAVLAMGPALPLESRDPEAALDGVSRKIELVNAVAKDQGVSEALRDRHEDQLAELEQYRDKLADCLSKTRGARRYPVRAQHFSVEAQRWLTLDVFAAEAGGKWWIVDWTNPAVRGLTGQYDGSGESPKAALDDAIESWDSGNRYPDGMMRYEIANIPGVPTIRSEFDTNGSSFWDSIASFFTWVGIGAAATAAAIMFLSPVPGPQAVSVAIWASIFSSTAAATINIGQRAAEGFSSWRANAFDVLTIVANMFGVAGVLWARGAAITTQLGPKVLKAVLIGQVTTDGVQGVLIAAEHVGQMDDIRKNPSLTPREKVDRILELCRSLAINGLLVYINVKGTKADLDNLNLKPKHIDGESPADTLKRLSDPNEHLDLTKKKPVAEGHTADGDHTTTVHIDQEGQPLHAGGRGKAPAPKPPPKKPPPKGPQKTADLDALYAQAGAAQQDLAALTRGIAKDLGGEAMIPPNLKGRARAQEKINADYDGDASQIVDLARSSIVLKTVDQVEAAVAQVKARAKVIRVKDRFERPVNGYRDVLFNLEMPNGHVVELQLHLQGIMTIKNGEGHALYEQVRTIDARVHAEKRAHTTSERQQITELNARMKKLYDDAFERAKRGGAR